MEEGEGGLGGREKEAGKVEGSLFGFRGKIEQENRRVEGRLWQTERQV